MAVMKAVILSINPSARLIDISHDIEPHNIISAAFVLYTAWDWFPEGTTFLSVIDPGVGSSRGILVALSEADPEADSETVTKQGKILVTPDNGIASMLLRMKPDTSTWNPSSALLRKSGSIYKSKSDTFHGRDIFAPLAALLSTSFHNIEIGEKCIPYVKQGIYPQIDPVKRQIIGKIVHIDHFGNCICSIHTNDLQETFNGSPVSIHHQNLQLLGLKRYYSQVAVGSPLAYIGSSGFLEIGVRDGAASSLYGIKSRDEVIVTAQ